MDGDGFDDLAAAVDNSLGGVDGHAFVFSGATRQPIYDLRRSGDDMLVLARK